MTAKVPTKFIPRPPEEREAFVKEKVESEGGASAIGHHFIQAYNEDKWGFYLRYVRGLRPRYTKPALIFGGAVHDAKEAFYVFNYDIDAMLEAFEAVMESRREEYEDRQKYLDDRDDGRKMLYVWANTWAEHDRETYEVVEVEGAHTFSLASGLRVSVRWDLLCRRRDNGKYYLFDTKTTRYSVRKAYEAVYGQDQATMYLLGMSKVYPDANVVGLVPDILYKRQSAVKAERPGIVFRSPREVTEYEQELVGLHLEMTRKIEALEAGFPYPHILFPRNGKNDSYFGSEWPDIYRAALPEDPYKAPAGYTVDKTLINEGPYGNPSLRAQDTNYDDILSKVV